MNIIHQSYYINNLMCSYNDFCRTLKSTMRNIGGIASKCIFKYIQIQFKAKTFFHKIIPEFCCSNCQKLLYIELISSSIQNNQINKNIHKGNISFWCHQPFNSIIYLNQNKFHFSCSNTQKLNNMCQNNNKDFVEKMLHPVKGFQYFNFCRYHKKFSKKLNSNNSLNFTPLYRKYKNKIQTGSNNDNVVLESFKFDLKNDQNNNYKNKHQNKKEIFLHKNISDDDDDDYIIFSNKEYGKHDCNYLLPQFEDNISSLLNEDMIDGKKKVSCEEYLIDYHYNIDSLLEKSNSLKYDCTNNDSSITFLLNNPYKSHKFVQFSKEIKYIPIDSVWSPEEQTASRNGKEWLQEAIDRCRFQDRINSISQQISWIFYHDHRQQIFLMHLESINV